MKDYAIISAGKGKTSLSIDDTRSSWGDSYQLDHAMLIVVGREKSKAKEKGESKRAKLRKAKKQSKTIRMKTERVLKSAKKLAKLRERLSEELSSLAKPEDLTNLLQRLIKEQSIEQSFPLRSGYWAAHLTEKEKISERKRIYQELVAKRTPDLKSRLMALNRDVKLITKECKVRAVEADLHRFEDLSTENSVREAYRVLKETLRTYRITWFDRARKSIGPSNMQFKLHYEELFRERKALDVNLTGQIQEETPDEMLNPPTRVETKLAIDSMSSGKAPGQSGITADLLKSQQDQLTPVINASFNNFWEGTSNTPKAFKDAKVISLFKKGAKTLPSNYRSIFLLDTEGKVFCKILKNRIERCTDQTLDDLQFGFRAGRSTLQAIWTVRRRI